MKWPPETFLNRLIRGLADKGVAVTVACSRKPEAKWLAHPNLNWIHTPGWNGSIGLRTFLAARMFWRALISSIGELQQFAQNMRQIEAGWKTPHLWFHRLPFVGRRWNLVYFPWNSAAIEYLPLFDAGMPVVISCRGSQINVAPHDPKRRFFVDLLRVTLQKAAAVHCVSEDIKREAMLYSLNPERAWVINPAVDPDFFSPLQKKPAADFTFNLISTGSLVWIKGYEYALLAVRRLKDMGVSVRYQIIGDGLEPSRQRLLYTIADLDLQNQVFLLGRLSPAEVRDRLQQADAFLLSSLSEGISNAALEAMACGLPVVTTDCGGMNEAITDGVEGFVVPVRDPEAMAGALARLAADRELRGRLGKAARKRVLQQFTLKDQVEKFFQLCRQVLWDRSHGDDLEECISGRHG